MRVKGIGLVIEWARPWNEVLHQDWPDIPGTIFITIDPNVPSNGKRFIVNQWVDDPAENVLGLGSFWRIEDARLFANARANDGGE